MTAHQLARQLLAGPDLPCVVNDGLNELGNGKEATTVETRWHYRTVYRDHCSDWYTCYDDSRNDPEEEYREVVNVRSGKL